MTYDDFISGVVKVVEGAGAAILVLGGLWALIVAGVAAVGGNARTTAYQQLRRNLGRVILLGLEVLIIGDIVRTIIVDPTFESVAVLHFESIWRVVIIDLLAVKEEADSAERRR